MCIDCGVRFSKHASSLFLHASCRSVSLIGASPLLLQPPSLFPAKSAPVSSSPFGVKKEWSGKTSAAVWNVKSDDLDLVPVDYPLERTHREIYQDATTVAKRISEALCGMSIETEYVSEKAKAKCKTNDCVSFRIRLYAGNETGEPVVVEIQRRCGSASSFMRSCRAILDSAEGKEVKTLAQAGQPRTLPPFMMKKPLGQMKCLQSLPPLKAPSLSMSPDVSLDNVVNMLQSNKRDVNILGLENLCSLTDPVKTLPAAAVSVSKSIILGCDKHNVRQDIRNLTECDIFGVEDDVALARHVNHVRHLALQVFANALGVCCKDGCLTDAVQQQSWFVEYLIPSLLDELKRAETNSSNAYHAAECLQSLIASSPSSRQTLVNNGGVAILEEAHTVGLRRHELLGSETKRCLESLGSTTVVS